MTRTRLSFWLILFLGGILFSGCRAVNAPPVVTATSRARPTPTETRLPEEIPQSFDFNIPFDGILPIYEPEFVPADESPYVDDELVLGIAWEGEAKAYSVTVLRFREMVDDELAGIPILVTY